MNSLFLQSFKFQFCLSSTSKIYKIVFSILLSTTMSINIIFYPHLLSQLSGKKRERKKSIKKCSANWIYLCTFCSKKVLKTISGWIKMVCFCQLIRMVQCRSKGTQKWLIYKENTSYLTRRRNAFMIPCILNKITTICLV